MASESLLPILRDLLALEDFHQMFEELLREKLTKIQDEVLGLQKGLVAVGKEKETETTELREVRSTADNTVALTSGRIQNADRLDSTPTASVAQNLTDRLNNLQTVFDELKESGYGFQTEVSNYKLKSNTNATEGAREHRLTHLHNSSSNGTRFSPTLAVEASLAD